MCVCVCVFVTKGICKDLLKRLHPSLSDTEEGFEEEKSHITNTVIEVFGMLIKAQYKVSVLIVHAHTHERPHTHAHAHAHAHTHAHTHTHTRAHAHTHPRTHTHAHAHTHAHTHTTHTHTHTHRQTDRGRERERERERERKRKREREREREGGREGGRERVCAPHSQYIRHHTQVCCHVHCLSALFPNHTEHLFGGQCKTASTRAVHWVSTPHAATLGYSGFHFLCSKLWTVADASSFALKLCRMLEKVCRGVPSSPISKKIRKGSSFPRKSA